MITRTFNKCIDDSMLSVAFTPDGKYIVLGGGYGSIRIWDIESNSEIQTFDKHTSCVFSIAFSPDSKNIVSRDKNGYIKLWETESGVLMRTFKGGDSIRATAITPDGKNIVFGGLNKIELWDIESGVLMRTFEGHCNSVLSIAITPDGKYLVSGNGNGTIKLWGMESGAVICQYAKLEDDEWIGSTTDGYYNCSSGAYRFFNFLDESKGMPKVVDRSHPIYKHRKRNKLLTL